MTSPTVVVNGGAVVASAERRNQHPAPERPVHWTSRTSRKTKLHKASGRVIHYGSPNGEEVASGPVRIGNGVDGGLVVGAYSGVGGVIDRVR